MAFRNLTCILILLIAGGAARAQVPAKPAGQTPAPKATVADKQQAPPAQEPAEKPSATPEQPKPPAAEQIVKDALAYLNNNPSYTVKFILSQNLEHGKVPDTGLPESVYRLTVRYDAARKADAIRIEGTGGLMKNTAVLHDPSRDKAHIIIQRREKVGGRWRVIRVPAKDVRVEDLFQAPLYAVIYYKLWQPVHSQPDSALKKDVKCDKSDVCAVSLLGDMARTRATFDAQRRILSLQVDYRDGKKAGTPEEYVPETLMQWSDFKAMRDIPDETFCPNAKCGK